MATSTTRPKPALRRLLWPYVALWLVVAVALVGYTWHEIDASYDREVTAGRIEAENLARVLAAQTGRSVESFGRTLALIKVVHESTPGGARLATLADSLNASGGSEIERRVLRYDRDGVLADATDPQVLHVRVTAEGLPWYQAARGQPNGAVVIGTPTIGRVSGRPTIPFAVRLADRDGAFDGVLVTALDPMRLVRMLREIRIGERSSVGIMNQAGLVYAWSEWSEASAKEVAAEHPLVVGDATDPDGIVVKVPVAGTDLVAFAALSEQRLLETHRRYALHLVAFGVLTLVGLTMPILLVARRAMREVSRRRRLEDGFALERTRARTDALTGIANRREYERVIASCLEELSRVRQPFVLAIIDVDRFKQLNDSLGHDTGDRALQRIAHTLASSVRRSDLVARLGGDEFAVVMPQTDARMMRRPFGAMFTALTLMATGEGWPIGFSVGVIAFETAPAGSTSPSELADSIMYDVKEAGRNGVRFAAYRDGRLRDVADTQDGAELPVA
jgi:diguanylate cyclase (GGDEF)-like protein